MKVCVCVDGSDLSLEACRFSARLCFGNGGSVSSSEKKNDNNNNNNNKEEKEGKTSSSSSDGSVGSHGGHLVLLHVVEKQSLDAVFDEEGAAISMAAAMAQLEEGKKKQASLLLDTWRDRLRSEFPALEISCRLLESSDARSEIVRALDEDLDCSLLVTGSRGLSSMQRIVLGSVSDYLAKNSPVPVLVYRHTNQP